MPRETAYDAADWWDRLDYSVLEREVSFIHPEIPDVRVTVHVWWDRHREANPYRFELSHYVHTPEQVRPYVPSDPTAETEVKAIQRGISAIIDQIERAKRAGHTPDGSWLLRRPPGR